MNRLSYFFRLFIPVALLLIVGAWLYANKEIDMALAQVSVNNAASVGAGAAAVLNKLEPLGSDLVFLASHSTTRVAVNRTTPENIAALADDFMTFSASKSLYDQIRWIDETGMERVRVDFRAGSPALIADEQLQDKSKRYFFTETIKLKPGEIFVSPLDLNIEHDKIEEPFKPMLRIATPVTNQLGQNRGILILNYFGSDLLQSLTQATGESDAHAMLVNNEGYWLKSDNSADEWGFMLNRPELNLAVRSPTAWQRIRNSDQGQLELDDGLWTWKTIFPLSRKRMDPASKLIPPSELYFWKVITHTPSDSLNSMRLAIWLKLTALVGIFLGVYGLGSWKLANIWCLLATLEVKYRTVADFAYDWETWIDSANRYLYCSPSCVRITGYSAQEFISNPLLLTEIVYPDDRPEVIAHFQHHKAVDHVCQLAFRIVRADGEIRWLEHACQPVFDRNDLYMGRRASNRDITLRKQAEIALYESHQQMYSLLNSMAEGAYGVDTEGNCKFVNRSFLRILGYEHADEIIGKHIHELIHHSYPDGKHYPATECRMYAAYRHSEEVHVVDEVFWRKDGMAVPVEYRSQPIIINDTIIGAIATFVDISERKKAEENAQLASQYARSLIEASLDPLVTISAEGKITDVNTATEQITGVDRSRLIGSDFANYFTEPDQARAGHQQVFSQNCVTNYPLAIRHTSGKITDVLYNASLYRDPKGKVLGVLAAARDITERKQIEALLIDSESHLRTIIDNEPECIKIVDADGRLVQMNPAGLELIEADNFEQVAGKPVVNVIAPEYRQAYIDLHRRVLNGETLQMEYEIIGLKGHRRWLDTHAVPMKEASGNVVHLAVTRDISDRKQSEHQLRIAATVFESQEGMMVTDANNNILRVNRAFCNISGYSADEVIGKNPRILHSELQHQDFYLEMWESIDKTGTWEGEIWNRRKNGEVYPDYLTITAVKDQHGVVTHYVGTHVDITLRKAAAEEIERLAFYDPLTKLPNRRLLEDRLKPAITASYRSARHGALLFIDLDKFKTLNDTMGHDMGDLLLQQVAERLCACVRENDTVARLGGDEFVVMLQDLSEQATDAAKQAESVGQKILAALNESYNLHGRNYTSTPSIGATLFGIRDQTVEELLKQADTAMYHAKAAGRNAIRFFDS